MSQNNSKKIEKLEKLITTNEAELDRMVQIFKKAANEYDVDSIVSFLPYQISRIEELNCELRRLKRKLGLLEYLN